MSRGRAVGTAVASLSLCIVGGCGGGSPRGTAPIDASVTFNPVPVPPMLVDAVVPPDATEVDGASCAAVIESHPEEGFTHIPCTSPTTYLTDPPSSGNHYPIWAAYQTYDAPIPWGNLVHNLEHGAIDIVYNCPAGCADEVAQVQAWINALPPDPTCGTNRIILAPDPTLDVRFAASAWTWTLRADCFDATAFTQFFNDHYGRGRELVCAGGPSTLAGLCPP